MAGNGVESLVSWTMRFWTLTPASIGVEFLVAWAAEFWTLTAAGNEVGLLVAWAMDYSTSSFTQATMQVKSNNQEHKNEACRI